MPGRLTERDQAARGTRQPCTFCSRSRSVFLSHAYLKGWACSYNGCADASVPVNPPSDAEHAPIHIMDCSPERMRERFLRFAPKITHGSKQLPILWVPIHSSLESSDLQLERLRSPLSSEPDLHPKSI